MTFLGQIFHNILVQEYYIQMTHATEKWKNCVVTLQALVLHGHKVPDMKLNRGPEIKFMGISFTRE